MYYFKIYRKSVCGFSITCHLGTKRLYIYFFTSLSRVIKLAFKYFKSTQHTVYIIYWIYNSKKYTVQKPTWCMISKYCMCPKKGSCHQSSSTQNHRCLNSSSFELFVNWLFVSFNEFQLM